ncbi:glycosyltransferase family 4 protein [Candidatus Wolfebacteria bacterium]|nr:glycosyltransferase family 4 protein [Candidatus Wolfebacteria bacterium]
MDKKKILIFSMSYYPKFIGGAEVAIKEITDRISDIEFHMVTLRFDSTLPKEEKIGNVIVHRIGFAKKNPISNDLKKFPLHFNKHLYQFLAFFKAKKLHKKYNFDATWAMMAHSAGIPAGMFKKKYSKVPYMLTLQEGDPTEEIEVLMKKVWGLFTQAFTRADYLQAISTFLMNWGKSMGFSGEAVLIPNGVDIARFTSEVSREHIAQVCKNIGKKDGEVWLITTSRLVHKNAIDDVIRALEFLPSHIHFLILGDGPDKEMLENLAKDTGMSGRVHFYGFVDHSEIPAFYKACDIFIRPSRSEGMGNSFIEAMAAELPVIATREGGIADFLFDKKTGWAVSKDSPKQIVTAVEDILEGADGVDTIVQTAKEMVIKKYDWDIVVKEMKVLFDKVLTKY